MAEPWWDALERDDAEEPELDLPEEAGDICGDGSIIKTIDKSGEAGGKPTKGSSVKCHYVGTLLDGSKFDSSRDRNDPFSFTIGSGVIQGWSEGVATMRKGEVATFEIQSHKAYGERGSPPKIPANATLKFEIELLSFSAGGGPEDVSKARDSGVLKLQTHREAAEKSYRKPDKLSEVACHAKVRVKGPGGPVILSTKSEGGAPLAFTVGDGDVMTGLEEAVQSMEATEVAQFEFTPNYGAKEGEGAGKTLVAVVELLSLERDKQSWELDGDEAKIAHANARREQGNALFKAKKYSQATMRYESATGAFGGASDLSTEANAALVPCYLNLAACLLKSGKLRDAAGNCDKALAIDPKNIKGLYRKACALTDLGDWDTAKNILKDCLSIDPKNAGAQKQLKKVQDLRKSQVDKEKKMFGGMFDKVAFS